MSKTKMKRPAENHNSYQLSTNQATAAAFGGMQTQNLVFSGIPFVQTVNQPSIQVQPQFIQNPGMNTFLVNQVNPGTSYIHPNQLAIQLGGQMNQVI